MDEAYPYISKRLLTDDSPRLREALRYMIYGKSNVFDVERLIDLLQVRAGVRRRWWVRPAWWDGVGVGACVGGLRPFRGAVEGINQDEDGENDRHLGRKGS